MDESRRCRATSRRSGQRCGRAAIVGGTVCHIHGGKTPVVAAKARERAVRMAAEEAARRMVARAGVDADPIEHLLDSLYCSAALVQVYGQMVADLDNAAEVDLTARPGALRGEVWVETDEAGDQRLRADRLLVLDRQGFTRPHPFVALHHEALDRRAKYAALAIQAGVAERQVRLAEQQGALVAQVLRGVLADLGVADHPDAPAVMRRHLQLASGV